ncbi:DNA damage-inducible transcript 4 protein [Microcaecilia unicolor]|uniref:DNA damage-inducible transcript 4 protein n=1 Tax=Microcaecilia unicolor TaxID=1415580 RepID=A0A6P7Y712_9AMPH|nr:DNA damage-inducible transcript 4 protein [Microcaecilia unicolor]
MQALWESLSGSLPPSPDDDSSLRRFSFDGTYQHGGSLPSSDCESLSDSEDDTKVLDNTSLLDCDLLSDPEDDLLCSHLLKKIQRCLAKAKISAMRCSGLLIPDQLLQLVGQELMHLSFSEPCGLRGALIDLCVAHMKECHSVAQLTVDPSVVPTFQLTLLLRLDSRLWSRLQGLLSSRPTLVPGFMVLKKKLYSSEELLVEEC